ncbi:MAG: hypothetical protein EOO61_17750 [Hymenobacter sp.]|nr:MAG: hypothetical protein EOO61_17750 [Hymenobacter sp.]
MLINEKISSVKRAVQDNIERGYAAKKPDDLSCWTQNMYSRRRNAITPVMQKVMVVPEFGLNKRGFGDAYEMLKDSPQPHCSARRYVSITSKIQHCSKSTY